MFPCLFQLLGDSCTPWLLAPSLIFKTHSNLCFCHPISSCLWPLTFLPPSYKDPYNYMEPRIIMQDNCLISRSLITFAKSLLPRKVTWWGEGGGDTLLPPPPHQLIMGPVIIKGLSYCWLFCTCKWKHLGKSLTGHKHVTQWFSVGTGMGVWRMGKRIGEKLYILVLFGIFFQNIFTWVLAQTCGTGISRYRHQACMGEQTSPGDPATASG